MGLFGGIGNAFGSAVGAIGGSLVSGIFNKNEAEKNRDWQTNMANTSYQRAVEDMKAAGLNPMLAISSPGGFGGASTPSGAQASISNVDFSAMINALTNVRAQNSQADLNDTAARLNEQKAITEEVARREKEVNILLKGSQVETETFKQNYLAAQTNSEKEKILNMYAVRNNLDANTKKAIASAMLDIEELETRKKDYGRTEAGLKDRHEANTHSSLTSAIGTQVDRTVRGVKEFFSDIGDSFKKINARPKSRDRRE